MKQNPYSKSSGDSAVNAGISGLRADAVDMTAVPHVVNQMVATRPPVARRSIGLRYLLVGGAAAGAACFALWPRVSSAASLREIDAALQHQSSRYEEILKPDANGKLRVYMEMWGKPGKATTRFKDGVEFRANGKVSYVYRPKENFQRIQRALVDEIDKVGVETYSQFKLVRTEREGPNTRYVFRMSPARQDLLVDTATNLPLERDVWKADGSLMEVHRYHFQAVDDRIFEPDIKPGVPLLNIVEDEKRVAAMLSGKPESQVVAGVRLNLHAVIIGMDGYLSAVVSGGAPRSPSSKDVLEIVGAPRPFPMTGGEYTTLSGRIPGFPNHLIADGHPARLEKVKFRDKGAIPGSFVIRVPVWKLDPKLPLLDEGKVVGIDSRLVGWAEFVVKDPIRTEEIEKVLPTYVLPPAVMKATTGPPKVIPARR